MSVSAEVSTIFDQDAPEQSSSNRFGARLVGFLSSASKKAKQLITKPLALLGLHPTYAREKELQGEWSRNDIENHEAEYKKSGSKLSYLDWLRQNKTTKRHPVNYQIDPQEKEKLKLNFDKPRQITQGEKTEAYDTQNLRGKMPGYAAFVLQPNGFYCIQHNHKSLVKTSHVTLTGGENVVAAGMVKVVQGKIKNINNFSGHYKPTAQHIAQALQTIPQEAFHPKATVTIYENRFGELGDQLIKKGSLTLGRILNWFKSKETLSLADFNQRHAQPAPNLKVPSPHRTILNKLEKTPIKKPIMTPIENLSAEPVYPPVLSERQTAVVPRPAVQQIFEDELSLPVPTLRMGQAACAG